MNKYAFGIDVGGTTVKCGLFDDEGSLIYKDEIPTRKEDSGSHICDDIKEHIQELIVSQNVNLEDILGAGIGVPGSVTSDGVVNKCINLGWDVMNISQIMREKLDLNVEIINDANAAAFGEYWQGGAMDYSSMMFVTIGTGVGGGLIIDGNIVNGANGAGAEIGHIPIAEDEQELCNCGKIGCLETVASATGIVRVAKRMLAEYEDPTTLTGYTNLSAKNIFDEAKSGDKLAGLIADRVSDYLGKGLACAAGVADPECFIIGGGVSAAGEYFTNLIQKHYSEYAFHPSKETPILLAQLGNDAGMYGAAGFILNKY